MTTDASSLKFTLLGSGTSVGIPVLRCRCRVCTSKDPRDNRLRCSCHVEVNGISIIIDTGPDFREQAIRYGVQDIDAVLYTHPHFDHIAGMDDLRPYLFGNKTAIPCYVDGPTAERFMEVYDYIFSSKPYPSAPSLLLRRIVGDFDVTSRQDIDEKVTVTPIPLMHGNLSVTGFRIGPFAYMTDTSHVPEESNPLLKGVEILVLDALRDEPHPSHLSIPQAIEVAERVGARETYFTHITHSVLHSITEAKLPDGIHLGYDGLSKTIALTAGS